jgi:hypothetical protein
VSLSFVADDCDTSREKKKEERKSDPKQGAADHWQIEGAQHGAHK